MEIVMSVVLCKGKNRRFGGTRIYFTVINEELTFDEIFVVDGVCYKPITWTRNEAGSSETSVPSYHSGTLFVVKIHNNTVNKCGMFGEESVSEILQKYFYCWKWQP
jgi:hypothetical protein